MTLPPTEAANELSDNLDSLDALGFVRVLRGVDAQIFSGWRHHEGLLDEGPLNAAEAASQSAAEILKAGGVVALTGCGTSGRVAHLVARRMNRLHPPDLSIVSQPGTPGHRTLLEAKDTAEAAAKLKSFDYLISGGDAALLLSDELPEDDPRLGAIQLALLAKDRSRCLHIGISCGLSAPYVAGQLDHAIFATHFTAAAIGFNPSDLSRDATVDGLHAGRNSFRDVAKALEEASPIHSLVNPVVGPEAVAGSSRMKGGTATLILADAICYRAVCISKGLSAPTIPDAIGHAQTTIRLTYMEAKSIASVCEHAANAMRSGGRLYYLGEGSAGVLGCIDASEMPDTYGVPFDTVRGFVCGGWKDVDNREGDLAKTSPLLRLSLDDFYEDILPNLTMNDAVILLGTACEPRKASADASRLARNAASRARTQGEDPEVAQATAGNEFPWDADDAKRELFPTSADQENYDGFLSDRMWSAVLRLRKAKVGSICLLASCLLSDAEGLKMAATAAQLDSFALVPLPQAGYGPGHGSLSELSLKLMLNHVSTYAMTSRGLVYRNRMIGTSPTNDKIYHRCISMIAELANVSRDDAFTALLRSIYLKDHLPPSFKTAPTEVHIIAATPTGDAQYSQQLVLPIAILLAITPEATVAQAKEMLMVEPRVSMLLRRLRPQQGQKQSGPVDLSDIDSAPTAASAKTTTAPRRAYTAPPPLREYVLGLDLGATSIKCAITRLEDNSLVGTVSRTPVEAHKKDFSSVVTALADAANDLVASASSAASSSSTPGITWSDIAAVGLSQPGAIDRTTGLVAAAANFPLWEVDVDLRSAVAEALQKRVILIEDADAALLAELQPGGAAAPPTEGTPPLQHTAFLLVLGGGVGSSLSIDGNIHHGATGLIEAGHMIVHPQGKECACGQYGCLEMYASGTAIAKRAEELLMGKGINEELDAKSVAERARSASDATAAKIMGEASAALATAIIAICRLVDPHVIILAGGVATRLLLDSVEQQFEARQWTILKNNMRIVLATHGENAGVLGAAARAADAADAMQTATFTVRQATPDDRSAALRVCLLTGDEGYDASDQYVYDPDALGKRWVAPYLDLQPDLAFVLEDEDGLVCGYCLAALDSTEFAKRLQEEYLPPLQAIHPDPTGDESSWTPEEQVYHELHDKKAGEPPQGLDLSLYPSHLHIDLIPLAQGSGNGVAMMHAQMNALRAKGSKGAYLQMHEGNTRARRFYAKLGFEELQGVGDPEAAGTGGALYLGIRFT